jgi:hypothetical protein
MMAGRDRLNGTDGNDNDLFRNTDNDPNQGGLERIAGNADNAIKGLGARYMEHLTEDLGWTTGIGSWVKDYFTTFGFISIMPYIIPTMYGIRDDNDLRFTHDSAFKTGIITGIAGWLAQIGGYGYLMFKDLGHDGGRFNWEYLLVLPAANLIDLVVVEPLRKSIQDMKEEKAREERYR